MPLLVPENPHNAKYYETKRTKMGHILPRTNGGDSLNGKAPRKRAPTPPVTVP